MTISGDETKIITIDCVSSGDDQSSDQRVGDDFSLKNAMLDDIIARVGRSSDRDALRFNDVCRYCNTSQKSDAVMKVINTVPFMSNMSRSDQCESFFTEAIDAGNPETSYLQRIRWLTTFKTCLLQWVLLTVHCLLASIGNIPTSDVCCLSRTLQHSS